jgi:hypothetical protein
MSEQPRARKPGIFILSILFAAVPFAFALIRAFQTGTDFRYLWLAIAALISAALVMVIGKAREGRRNVVLALWAVAFCTSTLVTVLVGRLLEARSSAAIWVIAIAFGLFSATGQLLYTLSRSREI